MLYFIFLDIVVKYCWIIMLVIRNYFVIIYGLVFIIIIYIYMLYDILCYGVKLFCLLYNVCIFKKFNIFFLRLFDI